MMSLSADVLLMGCRRPCGSKQDVAWSQNQVVVVLDGDDGDSPTDMDMIYRANLDYSTSKTEGKGKPRGGKM